MTDQLDEESLSRALWRAPAGDVHTPVGPRLRRAIVPAVASFLRPGAGQLPDRTWVRAGTFFVVWAAAWVAQIRPLWCLVFLFASLEAGRTAARPTDVRAPPRPSR